MVSISEDSTERPLPTWDPEQRAVVTAPSDARLIVTAGPGTGKTAVACGRVAHLITELEVEPSCILLLSFTRTAVAEIRNRIVTYVGSESRAAGIKIATLDSTTWSLLSGLDPDADNLLGGYDANIDRLCRMVADGEDEILDYLEQIEQLVVDEAQDVLGNRAELVAQIIRRLPSTCGVTVLADACQSIYGFTNEDGQADRGNLESLVDLLSRSRFRSAQLTRLHRTSKDSLIRLLEATRPLVENAKDGDRDGYAAIRETILSTAPILDVGGDDLTPLIRGRDDLMVLYRTRAEALSAASYLANDGVPHRLRLSGLPVWLHAWIAVLFSDFSADIIDEADFSARWAATKCGSLPGAPTAAAAWRASLNVASHRGRVRVSQLRRVLSRARPPIEFCVVDNGFEGPVVGTVHASKGREANDVLLFLPPEREEGVAWDEEARVLYVGVTRARRETCVAVAGATYSKFLEEAGRTVRAQRTAMRAQFEVGRGADLDVFSVASTRLHGDAASVVRQQEWLADRAAVIEKWSLRTEREWDWAYRLVADQDGKTSFGEMSPTFKRQVHAIARELRAKDPTTIPHIRKVGVRTIAVQPESDQLHELAPPYSRTGFFLAPVVRAWTMVRFWPWR
jgi:hypothetical protein